MSSRSEYRRRDRSWERDDRDRDRDRDRHSRDHHGRESGSRSHHDDGHRRSSRSRSPSRRGGERDRRGGYDRRDRERDRRDGRDDWRKEDDKRRDEKRDREEWRHSPQRGGSRRPTKEEEDSRRRTAQPFIASAPPQANAASAPSPTALRLNLDPDAPVAGTEEGEAMDATNDEDVAMMSSMGLTGFGSTKGKAVEGNQEGAAHMKKTRTWRQYMNRRGGFNRPLDKIK